MPHVCLVTSHWTVFAHGYLQEALRVTKDLVDEAEAARRDGSKKDIGTTVKRKDIHSIEHQLGRVLYKIKDHAAAEKALRAAMDGRRASLRPNHAQLLNTRKELAAVLCDSDKPAEAAKVFADAADRVAEAFGAEEHKHRADFEALKARIDEQNSAVNTEQKKRIIESYTDICKVAYAACATP